MENFIFIARAGHDWLSLAGNPASTMSAFTSYNTAVRYVHSVFLSFDFVLIDNRPWDPDNSNRSQSQVVKFPDDSGFKAFSDVVTVEVNGELMVAGFSHCNGDGPHCDITRVAVEE